MCQQRPCTLNFQAILLYSVRFVLLNSYCQVCGKGFHPSFIRRKCHTHPVLIRGTHRSWCTHCHREIKVSLFREVGRARFVNSISTVQVVEKGSSFFHQKEVSQTSCAHLKYSSNLVHTRSQWNQGQSFQRGLKCEACGLIFDCQVCGKGFHPSFIRRKCHKHLVLIQGTHHSWGTHWQRENRASLSERFGASGAGFQ